MNMVFTYEKTIDAVCHDQIQIPLVFDCRIPIGKMFSYDELRNEFIEKTLSKLNKNPKVSNVEIHRDYVSYDELRENYIDINEVIEIETLDQLVKEMEKRDLSYLYLDNGILKVE